MAVYTFGPLFLPQYVASGSSAALTLAAGGTAVAASTSYQVTELRVSNVTSSPVTLSVWFVPTGSTADNQHLLINNVTIPVASNTNPYFDVGDLFGKALPAGSAVWMLAGTASALVVSGSGTMIV